MGEDHNFVFWDCRNLKISRLLLGNPIELIHCQFVPVPISHYYSQLPIKKITTDGTIATVENQSKFDQHEGKEKRKKKGKLNIFDKDGDKVDTENYTNQASYVGRYNINSNYDEEEIERMQKIIKSLHEKALVLRSDSKISLIEFSDKGSAKASFISGHQTTVLCADVSFDGCWIASGSKDCSVRISSSRTESTVAILRGHTAPIVAIQVNKKR